GQDLHRIWFAPLRGEARLAGAAFVEEGLDVGGGERDAGRAAVHNAAERHAMALAERRDAEQVAERIVGHGEPVRAVGSPRSLEGQIGPACPSRGRCRRARPKARQLAERTTRKLNAYSSD